MNSANMPEFFAHQFAFTCHIREPKQNPKPVDVEERCMRIYRELLYNNIEGLLSTNFPVLRSVLPIDRWHRLIHGFFAGHCCQTPLFHEIAQEFLSWLEREHETSDNDFPFLLELAHYEWAELSLFLRDSDSVISDVDPNAALLEGVPVMSPVACSVSYRFPVHRISSEFLPSEPGEELTHLVIYRDRSEAMHFLEINLVTKRLLELVEKNNQATGFKILETIVMELRHPQPDVVIAAGTDVMNDLRDRNIILGVRI